MLGWQFITDSSVEFAGMQSVEFLTYMVSKTQSHMNPHVEPGANESCWTSYNAENVRRMQFKMCIIFCFSTSPRFDDSKFLKV